MNYEFYGFLFQLVSSFASVAFFVLADLWLIKQLLGRGDLQGG